MHSRWIPGGIVRALAVLLLPAGVLIGLAPQAAPASACVSSAGVQPPDPGSAATLKGVAVLSSCSAWAVGSYRNGSADQTLIEHWNGSRWKQVASPDPGGAASNNVLNGVTATSPASIWAVGSYRNGGTDQTLIEHWNGTAWKQVASPNPGGSANGNYLNGVTATSAGNAWAVGYDFNGTANQTLIEHWNGAAWKHVPSPNPGGSASNDALLGVSASSTSVWAVGDYLNGTAAQPLALHCC